MKPSNGKKKWNPKYSYQLEEEEAFFGLFSASFASVKICVFIHACHLYLAMLDMSVHFFRSFNFVCFLFYTLTKWCYTVCICLHSSELDPWTFNIMFISSHNFLFYFFFISGHFYATNTIFLKRIDFYDIYWAPLQNNDMRTNVKWWLWGEKTRPRPFECYVCCIANGIYSILSQIDGFLHIIISTKIYNLFSISFFYSN